MTGLEVTYIFLVSLFTIYSLLLLQKKSILIIPVFIFFLIWLQTENYITHQNTIISISLITILSISYLFTPIRRTLITKFLFKIIAKKIPPISSTEKEAMDAGDVWLEKHFFEGKPNWKKLLNLPKSELTKEEQDFINVKVNKLCSMLDDWEINKKTYDLSKEAWDYIKKEGFLSLMTPKKFGGLGFSNLANSTIVQKISTKSLAAAVSVMVPNSLGPAELIQHYGTDEQKNKYLSKLASGEEIPCFALTGLDSGSDAGSIPDKGIVCYGEYEGKKVLGLSLTWDKRYITLAPIATLLGLAVKAYDPDNLLKRNQENLGITLCLVPTNLPGVETGRRHLPMNHAFMNGPTKGNNVFVPIENIIGGEKMIGHGWKMLVECLSAGRGISLPALATACGKICTRTTGAYAKVRKQFNTSIGNFEGVQQAMARIGGYTYMLEATRLLTLTALDQGLKPSIITAIAKYHMTEFGRQAVNDAMDVHAGKGIILGRKNYLASGYQGIPISITVEGANILTRSLIIFGQGATRCHPFIKKEMLAIANENKKQGLIDFDKAIWGHISFTLRNILKLKLNFVNKIYTSSPIKGKFKNYAKKINKLSLSFAVCSDLAMILLGGALKRKEQLSARLGDVASYLYIASAVLKYYKDNGEQKDDISFVKWSLETCIFRIKEALYGFLQNFPVRIIARPLKLIMFPLGLSYPKHKDKLETEISKIMMTDSGFRNRLTKDCYINQADKFDPVGQLELAFTKLIEISPILKKINLATKNNLLLKDSSIVNQAKQAFEKNIITENELEKIEKYEKVRIEVIKVDDFAKGELEGVI